MEKNIDKMKLSEETLIEIQDYISHLNETCGLTPGTLDDIEKAIDVYKAKIKPVKCIGCGKYIPRTDDTNCCDSCWLKI